MKYDCLFSHTVRRLVEFSDTLNSCSCVCIYGIGGWVVVSNGWHCWKDHNLRHRISA